MSSGDREPARIRGEALTADATSKKAGESSSNKYTGAVSRGWRKGGTHSTPVVNVKPETTTTTAKHAETEAEEK